MPIKRKVEVEGYNDNVQQDNKRSKIIGELGALDNKSYQSQNNHHSSLSPELSLDADDDINEILEIIIPNISDHNRNKVLHTYDTLKNDPAYKYFSPRKIVEASLHKTFPHQFAHSKKSAFFPYAFPEGEIKQTEVQDLLNAGYNARTVNNLMAKLRTEISVKNTKDTCTLVLDAPLNNIDLKDSLYKYLSSTFQTIAVGSILNKAEQKIVILMPFLYDNHWYSSVIHIDKSTQNDIKVNILINNPYGSTNLEESAYDSIIQQIERSVSSKDLDEKVIFKFNSTSQDIQGFFYDNTNCGVVAVYCITKYAFYAQLNYSIEQYNIPIFFDQFLDLELNKKVYTSFILRLKVEQLSTLSSDAAILGFHEVPTNDKIDLFRSKAVKKQTELLLNKINNKALEVYINYLDKTQIESVRSLNNIKQFKLWNLVSEDIIKEVSQNFIFPSFFSVKLERIIKVFHENEVSIEPMPEDMYSLLEAINLNAFLSINKSLGIDKSYIFTQTTDTRLINLIQKHSFEEYMSFIKSLTLSEINSIINNQDAYGNTALLIAAKKGNTEMVKDLLKRGANINLLCHAYNVDANITGQKLNALGASALEANNLEVLSLLLQHTKAKLSKAEFLNKITDVLNTILNIWEHYADKSQVDETGIKFELTSLLEGRQFKGRAGVVDILLSEGADVFRTPLDHCIIDSYETLSTRVIHGISTFNIATKLKPAIANVIYKYFSEKLNFIFLSAISNFNIELVKTTLFSPYITKEDLEAGARLLIALEQENNRNMEKSKRSTYSTPFYYDPDHNKEMRLKPYLIQSIKTLLEERFKAEFKATSKAHNPHTQLIRAAKNGTLELIQELFNNNEVKNIDMFDENGMNALLWATSNNHTLITTYLLAQGASLNVISAEGYTPVMLMIFEKQVDMLDRLLQNKLFSLKSKINTGEDILTFAIKTEKLESLQTLLKHSVLDNSQEDYSIIIQKGLIYAAANGNSEIIKLLVTYGADINKVIDNSTALIRAIHSGKNEAVKELISLGADINIWDGKTTPLIAAVNSDIEILKLLINNNANLNTQILGGHYFDKEESKFYTYNEINNDYSKIFKDAYIITALREALYNFKYDAAILLIQAGSIIDFNNMRNELKLTLEKVLYETVERNNDLVVKNILSSAIGYSEKESWEAQVR